MAFSYPALVVHCDWGSAPRKRQMSAALFKNNRYHILSPRLIYDPSNLIKDLRDFVSPADCVLIGFDFPIGLPISYARLTGIEDFLSALPLFGEAAWHDFYIPASTPDEIKPFRPFYPQKPGNSRRAYLVNGLGLESFDQLRRLCEITDGKRSACPLFWTMGGQQVGKAAIMGWRDVIAPTLVEPDLSVEVWPFSGSLNELLQPGSIVIAETYPAEMYNHLGIKFPRIYGQRSGKRSQEARANNGPLLFKWVEDNQVFVEPEMEERIRGGFGTGSDGEDIFDSLIGLFGMLDVILGNCSEGLPPSNEIRKIEGWILGKT